MTVPSAPGLENTGQAIDLNAGHAQALRDALARHDGAGVVPGDRPGRTPDTGEWVDGI